MIMEETKVNFYDPQARADLYDTAQNQEDVAILEAAVDPLEWK